MRDFVRQQALSRRSQEQSQPPRSFSEIHLNLFPYCLSRVPRP
jgi:hypothetical protein